jgi:hypothetical protein
MDKLAIRYVTDDGNGGKTEKFVDANTGKEISDTSGYQVMDHYDEGLEDTSNGFASNPFAAVDITSEEADTTDRIQRTGEGNGDLSRYFNPDNNPDASNNFGYIQQPKALGLASMIPGPLGMAAKGVKTVMGIQNNIGAQDAREYLGLEKQGLMSQLGNVARDRKGYIGDVQFANNPNTYAVGLDAQDSKKRTTLTPDEARKRGLMAGGLTEATREEKQQNLKDFKTDKKAVLEHSPLGQLGLPQPADRSSIPMANSSELKNSGAVSPQSLAYHGLGLADFAPSNDPDLPTRDMAKVSYDLANAGRSEIPSSGIGSKVSDVVTDVLGAGYTVGVTSGQEPAGHKAVGTAHRHPEGWAADLHITDPQGRVLDQSNPQDRQAIKDVATGMAARYGANFGMGNEYMGNSTMHIDTMDTSKVKGAGKEWASLGKQWAGDLEKARQTGVMPSQYYDVQNPPEPKARPQQFPSFAQEPEQKTVDANRWNGVTDQDRQLMAQTLAGEIDPSKTDLSTPVGRQEAYGILSTVENRAPKYGGVSKAIQAPQQYSTWNNDAAKNTALSNYNANPETYSGLVNSYMADPKSNLGFTSYHAATVNPGWSADMQNATEIGPHKFGVIADQMTDPTKKTAAQNLVQPKTVFNSTSVTSPMAPTGGMVGQDSSSFMSKTVSNKPATNQSTAPTANVSGTGSSKSNDSTRQSGLMSTPTASSKSTSVSQKEKDKVTTGGGWGQRA